MAEQAKAKKKQPDWSRFGLSREPVKGESDLTRSASEIQDGSYQSLEEGKHNELYREDQVWEFIRFWLKKLLKLLGKIIQQYRFAQIHIKLGRKKDV